MLPRLSRFDFVHKYIGGYGTGSNPRDEILELVDNEWSNVATMEMARNGHAVTIINVEDYWMFCNK